MRPWYACIVCCCYCYCYCYIVCVRWEQTKLRLPDCGIDEQGAEVDHVACLTSRCCEHTAVLLRQRWAVGKLEVARALRRTIPEELFASLCGKWRAAGAATFTFRCSSRLRHEEQAAAAYALHFFHGLALCSTQCFYVPTALMRRLTPHTGPSGGSLNQGTKYYGRVECSSLHSSSTLALSG